MSKFAFISRHTPNPTQVALAASKGIELVPVGDRDAFKVNPYDPAFAECDGVVVVHPAAAMRLAHYFKIGVFENANRAPEGERPSFEAVSFQVYDLRTLRL